MLPLVVWVHRPDWRSCAHAATGVTLDHHPGHRPWGLVQGDGRGSTRWRGRVEEAKLERVSTAGELPGLGDLPLRVDGYELEVGTRSTVVRLRGAGLEGIGEDFTWAPSDQLGFRLAGEVLALSGDWTVQEFSKRLAQLDLFPSGPSDPAFRRLRRWAFERAALELALRQWWHAHGPPPFIAS